MCSSGLEALSCPFSTKFLRIKDLRFTTSPAIATYTLLAVGLLFNLFYIFTTKPYFSFLYYLCIRVVKENR